MWRMCCRKVLGVIVVHARARVVCLDGDKQKRSIRNVTRRQCHWRGARERPTKYLSLRRRKKVYIKEKKKKDFSSSWRGIVRALDREGEYTRAELL